MSEHLQRLDDSLDGCCWFAESRNEELLFGRFFIACTPSFNFHSLFGANSSCTNLSASPLTHSVPYQKAIITDTMQNDNDNTANGNGNEAGGEELPAPTTDAADAITLHANTIEAEEMEVEAAPEIRSAVIRPPTNDQRPTTRNERKKKLRLIRKKRTKKTSMHTEKTRRKLQNQITLKKE